jgi:pimeloyl-ACP methyl ester carboxylesterase
MGAPPALLWAADHPEEIRGLLYMEVPVMLSSVLTKIIAYTPEAMEKGSMWWWILPLAPGVPERLVVGREREFITWFFNLAAGNKSAITEEDVDEYLRTFSGRQGVLGAMGVYRAAFTTIAQTEPLQRTKVSVPVAAVGGAKAQGDKVREMVSMVASNVIGHTVPGCGHFLPEECPQQIAKFIGEFTK